ncbi:hypothetical protein KRP22_009884 [Phytophthora ramorum]|nr:hypothetical protein KRP22_10057 [Phytophthora ramorum]
MLDAEDQCVAVTGTPGIGKSIFYSYCFQRFRKEVDNMWIIGAACRRHNLTRATVFKGKGSNEGEILGRKEEAIDERRKSFCC